MLQEDIRESFIRQREMKKTFINKGDLSLKGKNLKGKIKDAIVYGLIGLATLITVSILLYIISFIFIKGVGKLNWHFFTASYESETNYVYVNAIDTGEENKLGIQLDFKEVEGKEVIYIDQIESTSLAKEGLNAAKKAYPLKEGDIVSKIGRNNLDDTSIEQANELINNEKGTVRLKIVREGGGVMEMMVTTLIMIVLALAIACPIGIFSAIYLTEYAKPGRLVTLIRFATESLSGIPSIIYGLFGMLFFVATLKLGFSILAGALTLSIILLPVIIRQTEESLKAVPMTYREGSLGLGASKLLTIRKAVLPSAIPGIVVAIILSIGRIVGESAALLLTAGTVARIPNSVLMGASTLTVKAYTVAKEEGNIVMACAIGSVVLIIIFILNTLAKLITRKFSKI